MINNKDISNRITSNRDISNRDISSRDTSSRDTSSKDISRDTNRAISSKGSSRVHTAMVMVTRLLLRKERL